MSCHTDTSSSSRFTFHPIGDGATIAWRRLAILILVAGMFTSTAVGQDPPGNETPGVVEGQNAAGQTNVQDGQKAEGVAAPTLNSDELYGKSFRALFVLFILAVVLESGLAVVFNWRPYIEFFDSRGTKTLICFGVSWYFVHRFNLDIATTLVNIYRETTDPVSGPGKCITALVVAGGSSGVNNMMMALGFRSVDRTAQVNAKPKPTEAWVALRLVKSAVYPVNVMITDRTTNTSTVAGIIKKQSTRVPVLRYFVRDFGRFPTAGGYALTPGQDYSIHLEGIDAAGNVVTSKTWGPHKLAPGAIVDIDVEM